MNLKDTEKWCWINALDFKSVGWEMKANGNHHQTDWISLQSKMSTSHPLPLVRGSKAVWNFHSNHTATARAWAKGNDYRVQRWIESPLSRSMLLVSVKLNATAKIKRADNPVTTKLSCVPAGIMSNISTKAVQLMEIKMDKDWDDPADVGAN